MIAISYVSLSVDIKRIKAKMIMIATCVVVDPIFYIVIYYFTAIKKVDSLACALV